MARPRGAAVARTDGIDYLPFLGGWCAVNCHTPEAGV
jgi:hypothetical protein